MNQRYIKIGIVSLLVIFAIYQFFLINIGWGILVLLLAGLVFFTLFWHEQHLLALLFMRRNKFASAETALSRIKNPEQNLTKSQEAFHYFMLGNLESSKKNLYKAETWYKRALSAGLKIKTNQAIAKLNLAAAALTRRRKREAQMLLKDVKQLDKYGMLSDQVKFIEQQMKKI